MPCPALHFEHTHAQPSSSSSQVLCKNVQTGWQADCKLACKFARFCELASILIEQNLTAYFAKKIIILLLLGLNQAVRSRNQRLISAHTHIHTWVYVYKLQTTCSRGKNMHNNSHSWGEYFYFFIYLQLWLKSMCALLHIANLISIKKQNSVKSCTQWCMELVRN